MTTTEQQIAELTRIWESTPANPDAYARAAIAYLSQKPYRIDKNGRVIVRSRVVGHVDRYDQSKPNRIGSTWRAVREGGETAAQRFDTRADAAAWVATAY